MASWSDVEAVAPELTAAVRARFGAHKHALLATLRRDGSPRLSGVETQFTLGELWMGMMGGSRKALDLRRDGRFALHSAPDSPEIPEGDAKVSGRAVEITDQATINAWSAGLPQAAPTPFHLFRVAVAEVSLLTVEGDHLAIEWWRESDGLHRVDRK